MSDKKELPRAANALKPLVEDIAQNLGRKLPDLIGRIGAKLTEKGLVKDHSIIASIGEALSKLPTVIKMVGGVVQVPRGIFPDGEAGDIAHEYANEIIDELARGAAEGLNPKEGHKPTDGSPKAASADAPTKRLGYVVNGVWYPASCTHVARPFAGKGNRGPDDISLEEAQARGHDYCRRCVRDLAPAKDEPKEAKEDAAETSPRPKLPESDHTLLDLFERLRNEDALVYAAKWPAYRETVKNDEALAKKFHDAFNGRGTYAQFAFVVCDHESGEWHLALDCLLGRVTPQSSFWKGLLEKEISESERAVKALIGAVDKAGDTLAGANAKIRASNKKLREDIEAFKRDGERKNWAAKIAFWAIVLLGLSVYAVITLN